MKLLKLRPSDATAVRWLGIAFFAPYIDPRTGMADVVIGEDRTRLDAALKLKRALESVLNRETLTLVAGDEHELVLEDSASFALLEEHWRARRAKLPPALADEIKAVDDLLARAEDVSVEEYARRKAAPITAA